ncbi:1,6-anhydro-N-acetylmuramyl-L-alanine amidase AmpD [Aquisalimonas asiatica]|uniref:1,6-anhydro-N-acetylmuramyl-L-alanine amidase AmpD n=1 Tax=Aquisalimonas asiatica TaxID=406100 RepID=A0A1H8VEP3_9GAMM|nr:1,6-anhydro-N-acetylmuramyl-L-alanine amidase AmpD [Aquisalimonas asiatica]SEP13348.1 N-acetylmuramyl-L-alanine amidase, negative regulator of AmpC, AmpD [Aquisalimonas asiatica]
MALHDPVVNPETGLVTGAVQAWSPNHNARPAGVTPDLLVIHGISLPPGEFGGDGVHQLFTNALDPAAHPYYAGIADLRVSAHLFLRRDGTLYQYVPLHRRAWHAGRSSWCGRDECNDYSVGIEVEGCDDVPYDDAQYAVLGPLCGAILRACPAMTRERIVGHSDIAPGRKTDPGAAFDWRRLAREIDRVAGERGQPT